MAQYQKKVTVVVEARQFAGPLTVGGNVVAEKGDWEITSGTGDSFILSDADFRKEYEPFPLPQQ